MIDPDESPSVNETPQMNSLRWNENTSLTEAATPNTSVCPRKLRANWFHRSFQIDHGTTFKFRRRLLLLRGNTRPNAQQQKNETRRGKIDMRHPKRRRRVHFLARLARPVTHRFTPTHRHAIKTRNAPRYNRAVLLIWAARSRGNLFHFLSEWCWNVYLGQFANVAASSANSRIERIIDESSSDEESVAANWESNCVGWRIGREKDCWLSEIRRGNWFVWVDSDLLVKAEDFRCIVCWGQKTKWITCDN